MAPRLEIAPLRGVLYDGAKAGPLDRLLAPPYDVISPADRESLEALSPHNVVRLILPKGEGDERYPNAARLYREWLGNGVLRRDERPALYRYQQAFTAEGRSYTRTGFIGRVRLRRFEERVVLPHERTLSAPKQDRLKLTRACGAWFSQVFGLYSDPSGAAEGAFGELAGRPPEMEARTADGTTHRLWRLTEPAAHGRLAEALADRRVYIADGHHRYETMVALRDELRTEAAQYGPLFLCRMEDPGLAVLATHRVVHSLPSFDLEGALRRAGQFFTSDEQRPGDAEAVRAELARRGQKAPTLGLVSGGRMFFLSLRPDADLAEAVPGPAVARRLDVTLLHSLLLERILGIDRAAQEKQTNLRYVKDFGQALRDAGGAGAQAVFLLNPTRVEDLKSVADAGEVMPQKSTYFFPKLASGLVIHSVE
ncbi:MAG: DUF1015 domain-containing protein [Myxococcales bacterium]